MQQYIDISPYRDTLGSDTVSIHILSCIDISNIVIYQCIAVYRHSDCILLHTVFYD